MVDMDALNLIGGFSKGINSLTHQLDILSSGSNRGIYDIKRNINYLQLNINNVHRSINEISCSLENIQRFFDGKRKY